MTRLERLVCEERCELVADRRPVGGSRSPHWNHPGWLYRDADHVRMHRLDIVAKLLKDLEAGHDVPNEQSHALRVGVGDLQQLLGA
eukprot:292371-Prymnesium_polylepis.1